MFLKIFTMPLKLTISVRINFVEEKVIKMGGGRRKTVYKTESELNILDPS